MTTANRASSNTQGTSHRNRNRAVLWGIIEAIIIVGIILAIVLTTGHHGGGGGGGGGGGY